MHQYYIAQGIVDGQAVHKQAWRRLTDSRTGGEDSIVHNHGFGGECNGRCTRYHNCVTTKLPGAHSITTACPMEESDNG